MAEVDPPRSLRVDDDRNHFDCGRESLNQWFRRNAWRNQQADVSRTSVLCQTRTGDILGFVTLSAGHIEREYLPKQLQRNMPQRIPVFLLGRLAVATTEQGRGYARLLLFFAMETCTRAAAEIGSFGVLTHPLDDGARQFYRRFGFEEVPHDPMHSMIVRTKDLLTSGFGSS